MGCSVEIAGSGETGIGVAGSVGLVVIEIGDLVGFVVGGGVALGVTGTLVWSTTITAVGVIGAGGSRLDKISRMSSTKTVRMNIARQENRIDAGLDRPLRFS